MPTQLPKAKNISSTHQIKTRIIVNYDDTIMIVIEPINDNFTTNSIDNLKPNKSMLALCTEHARILEKYAENPFTHSRL